MSQFQTKRELLNAHFEGYKLSIIPQEDSVSRFDLGTHCATQSTTSAKNLLTFKEVQSRITHNHIVISGRKAVYVDAEFNLIAINIEPTVSLRVVFDLPTPINTESTKIVKHKEYPSAAFLSSSVLLVSDGHSSLYLLQTAPTGLYKLIASYQLPGMPDIPSRVHSADFIAPDRAVVVLSARDYTPPAKQLMSKNLEVRFDLWGIEFDFSAGGEPVMKIVWHRQGGDVPLDVCYVPSQKCHVLLGGSAYDRVDTTPNPSYSPSPDEMAPIPRAGESLDAQSDTPPYSWHQTSDSLTVAYPLPATVVRSNIHVRFSARSISLHVEGNAPEGFAFPSFEDKALWAPLDLSGSMWTWDREANHAFGLLTLHIEKQSEDTKWMQVFSEAATDGEKEVAETVDPSELCKIRESLEKYTASLREGGDLSGLDLGKGVPSLAEGEMDGEVDFSVGKQACVTFVSSIGSQSLGAEPYPLRLLSTPLPGHPTVPLSLVLKESLDGPLFSLQDDLSWTHTSTFSALSFVLASKQDTRFVYHTENSVFAFESGAQNRGGNVYIYRSVPGKVQWAKQSVLQVGNGGSGALLGVGSMELGEGTRCIVCLTEKELVILRNVW